MNKRIEQERVPLLTLDTPDEFKQFIIDNNLLEEDNEVSLSIIIDSIILLATVNVNSPEDDSAKHVKNIVLSTINELGLSHTNELESSLTRLFENTYKLILSRLVAYDCYNKQIYCCKADIYKICLEVRDKGKAWQ